MADDNKSDGGILAEFQEFLEAKRAQETQDAQDDEYIEIWDKDGKGARVRRSHAKPFLQTLGLDLDPDTSGDSKDQDGDGKSGDKAKPGRKSNPGGGSNAPSGGVARKYFTNKRG